MPKLTQHNLVSYIWKILLNYPLGFISVIWLLCVRGLGTVLPQRYLSQIVDSIGKWSGGGNPFELVGGPFIKLMIFKIVLTASFRLWHYSYYYKSLPRMLQDIKTDAMETILEKSPWYFHKYLSGYISTRLNDLVHGIEDVLDILFDRNIISILNLLIPIIYLYTISPIIALCMIIPLLLVITGLWWSLRKLSLYGSRFYEASSNVDGKLVDILSNVLATKLFNTQAYETKNIYRDCGKVAEARTKLAFVFLILFLTSNDLFSIILFTITGYFIFTQLASGQMSTANFIFVLMQSLAVGNEIWMLLISVPELIRKYQRANYAIEILNEDSYIPEKPNAYKLELSHGEIEFTSVYFGYENKPNLFVDMNLRIPAKQKVALVGHSGSGKSTLTNLILRLYDVREGAVKLDGQDVRDVTMSSLYNSISVIPQNPLLLDRSILENIKYGNFKASEEEVIQAAKHASIHDAIDKMPQKYAGPASTLSGGQKQRIAIARAFLKASTKSHNIFIIDEGTSQIDSVTEKEIQRSLNTLMDQNTSIIIAHRLSTIENADRILVFQEGAIVEDGTHESLLELGGSYYKLWAAQNNGIIG